MVPCCMPLRIYRDPTQEVLPSVPKELIHIKPVLHGSHDPRAHCGLQGFKSGWKVSGTYRVIPCPLF